MSEAIRTPEAVYVGLRLNGDNLSHCWIILNGDGTKTDEAIYFRKGGKRRSVSTAWVGDIHQLTESEGGMWGAGPRLRQWPEPAERNEWRISEREDESRFEAAKLVRAENFGDLTLNELRERYAKLIGNTRRSATLASIIQFVTR